MDESTAARPSCTDPPDPQWVAGQVAKFTAADLRRAGKLLAELTGRDTQSGAA